MTSVSGDSSRTMTAGARVVASTLALSGACGSSAKNHADASIADAGAPCSSPGVTQTGCICSVDQPPGLRHCDTSMIWSACSCPPPRKADSAPKSAPGSFRDLKHQERAFILDALAKTRGKIYGPDGAAALLGLRPTTLSSRVHRMGLKKHLSKEMLPS
jgi:hypothetical protein